MSPWKEMGRYGFLGVELVTTLAVGYFAGRWLDARLHTGGALTWVGFLVGVGACVQLLVVTARRLTREAERIEREEEEERRAEEARDALRARDARDDEPTRDDEPKGGAPT